MKLVLFDCDGTIVDSAAYIHRCMAATFNETGLAPPSPAQTRAVIGLSLDRAIDRLAGETGARLEGRDTLAAMVAGYKQAFFRMRSEEGYREPLYDGMDALIHTLGARDDVVIGMVTGKSRRGVAAVLESHGLSPHFLVIRTADDCPSKPHPAMVTECMAETGFDPRDTAVIGDAIYDMEMARAAGARAIGVSWGYHEADQLRASGADHIAERPDDVLAFIE